MNAQLISIQQNDNGVTAVDARELHRTLESRQQFGNWIRNRIRQYGFIEGEDFLINLLKTPSIKGGRPETDYILTLDMAKELAMVEKTEKGRQVRKYFINIEKKAKELFGPERIKQLEARVSEMESLLLDRPTHKMPNINDDPNMYWLYTKELKYIIRHHFPKIKIMEDYDKFFEVHPEHSGRRLSFKELMKLISRHFSKKGLLIYGLVYDDVEYIYFTDRDSFPGEAIFY